MCRRRKRHLLASLAAQSKPGVNEEKWFRREIMRADSAGLFLLPQCPVLTAEGMRENGSAENNCDSRRASPPGRR